MGTHEPAPMSCPACGRRHDAHQPIGDASPQPSDGAISICFGCGEPAIYTDGATALRAPDAVERAQLLANHDVRRARAALSISKGDRR